MAFVRCYTGNDGQSHFEDLNLLPPDVERSIDQAAASLTFTRSPDGRFSEALVGFQGRGCADGVQPDFCYPLSLEALLFQWSSKCVTILGPRWSIRPRNPIRATPDWAGRCAPGQSAR